MAIMMGKLYAALRSANVPDKEAVEAAEEIAEHETRIGGLRADLAALEQRLLAALDSRVAALETRLHQRELRLIGVIAGMLGLLFALLKFTPGP